MYKTYTVMVYHKTHQNYNQVEYFGAQLQFIYFLTLSKFLTFQLKSPPFLVTVASCMQPTDTPTTWISFNFRH